MRNILQNSSNLWCTIYYALSLSLYTHTHTYHPSFLNRSSFIVRAKEAKYEIKINRHSYRRFILFKQKPKSPRTQKKKKKEGEIPA